MGLMMKSECEKCTQLIDAQGTAYICVHECTFCEDCTEEMDHTCPNCGGELVKRPRKPGVSVSCTI